MDYGKLVDKYIAFSVNIMQAFIMLSTFSLQPYCIPTVDNILSEVYSIPTGSVPVTCSNPARTRELQDCILLALI